MTHPKLEAEMRQVLAELEVWSSYGATASYQPTGGGDGGAGPSLPGIPVHLLWRGVWERASEDERPAVLDNARKALRGLRQAPRRKVTGESLEAFEKRIVKDGKGWPVQRVADAMRCTPTFVRRARRNAEVSEVDGTDVVVEMIARAERADKARDLKAKGMTLRQIAMHLGCGTATIHRDLAA